MVTAPWAWRRTGTAADYASVVIPLDEAHQHSHSCRLRHRSDPEAEGQVDDGAFDDDDAVGKDGDDEDTTMLVMSGGAAEYSIEGLRKEVRRGRREENWTAYESECAGALSPFVERCPGWIGLTGLCRSEISAYQQGHSGYRHGKV